MLCETYYKGNYLVIKFNDVLTLNSDITELLDIVNDFLKKNIINIAIHFKDGSFLSSGSGAIIVCCLETINDNNGSLAFVNIDQTIHSFLTITGLDLKIKIYNSEEELEFEA